MAQMRGWMPGGAVKVVVQPFLSSDSSDTAVTQLAQGEKNMKHIADAFISGRDGKISRRRRSEISDDCNCNSQLTVEGHFKDMDGVGGE